MVTKGRLEAFSDGVFAIVITLLAFDLRPPSHQAGVSLASALWDLWPSYLAYVVGFLQIGVMWLNHHRVFQQVRNVDGVLLVLNLNLLLWVAVVPFPTAVVADYLRDGGQDAATAMVLFSAVLLLNAISFVSLYAWITHDERIIGTLPPRAVVRAARLRFGLGLGAYAGALVLSWFVPVAALAVHAAMALYYAFDQATVSSDAPSTA
jgi:TMEM175 potassium channel family protein